MLNKIALSLLLVIIAAGPAFATQVVISTRAESGATRAAMADRLVPAGRKLAAWPNIPDRCLSVAVSRHVRVVAFGALS
jgi:hypothetical protein